MRRLLAIAIVFVLGLPAVTPLLALTGVADPSLPACCRRDGKHHCMAMAGMSSASLGTTQATTPSLSERCPFGSHSMPGTTHRDWTPGTSAAIFAGIVAHPSVSPQTESKRRISADRSRQKRGPPSNDLVAAKI